MIFRGSGTALVTPMSDGNIDWHSFARLIDQQVRGGTKALIACGTTGEPSTLSAQEQKEVVSFTKEHAGGLPVVAGIGGNNTAAVISAAQSMEDADIDGLLVVTPYYNKTTQKGLLAHYRAVADATDLPIILYNVPSRTGLNMLPATVAELSEHPNIVALKEANPLMEQVMEDFRLFGDRLDIYSGNDDMVYPIMAMGGAGVISVASNIIPADMQGIVDAFDEGDLARSRDLVHRYSPFIALLFAQVSPLPVKAALARMGMIENEVRLPLVPLTPGECGPLFEEMSRLELI